MSFCFKEFKNAIGPKGKSPWITDDDGEPVSDSQLIIEHLMKKHNIQMLKLTPEESAVARSLRALVEDNLVSNILLKLIGPLRYSGLARQCFTLSLLLKLPNFFSD